MGTGPAEPGSCAPGPASSWLQMFGLAAAVTTTYLIACAATGDIPALTDNSVPVRLFQMSGLYGMDRRYVEVAWQTTQAGIVGMAALGICDLVYARRTQARWFALHVIANFWISLLCMPDLYFVLSNPVEAIKTRTTGHWPTAIVFSVHLYHMFFFRKLQWIDWMHHILMVCIGAPLLSAR